jgi:hypothetical protein
VDREIPPAQPIQGDVLEELASMELEGFDCMYDHPRNGSLCCDEAKEPMKAPIQSRRDGLHPPS